MFIDIKVRIQNSAIRNRPVKHSPMIMQLIPRYRGSQRMNNSIGPLVTKNLVMKKERKQTEIAKVYLMKKMLSAKI